MVFPTLYKIKFLLLFELILIILASFNYFIPLFIILSLVVLCFVFYEVFSLPIVAVHILIFSILADSFLPINVSSSGSSLSVIEVVFLMLFTIGTIWLLLNLDKKTKIPILVLLWLPFLIWSLPVGLMVAIEKLKILVYWKVYLAGFFSLTFTYFAIQNETHLKSVIISIIIWGAILSLIELRVLIELGGFTSGLIGLFFRKNLLNVGWGRSNYVAAFFVVIIPIAIGYLFYTKSKKTKFLIISSLILMSFAIILTLSRGGILALLVALIILFSRIVKTRTLVPFLFLLLVLAIIVLINPLTYVLINRISSLDTSGSYLSRINFYKDVWHAFLRHPVTGVGFGNLGLYAQFAYPPDMPASAHNIILGMLGETGLFGAICFLSLLGALLKTAYTGFKLEANGSIRILRWGFVAAIIGAILHSLMEPTLEGLQFSIIFWTLAGVYLNLDILKSTNDYMLNRK